MPVFKRLDEFRFEDITPSFKPSNHSPETPQLFRKSSTSKCLKESYRQPVPLNESAVTWKHFAKFEGTEFLPETPKRPDMSAVTEKISALTTCFQEISVNQSKIEQILACQEVNLTPMDIATEITNLHEKIFSVQAEIKSLKNYVLRIDSGAPEEADGNPGTNTGAKPERESGNSKSFNKPAGGHDTNLAEQLKSQKQQVQKLIEDNAEKERIIQELMVGRAEHPTDSDEVQVTRGYDSLGKPGRDEFNPNMRARLTKLETELAQKNSQIHSLMQDLTRLRRTSRQQNPRNQGPFSKPNLGGASSKRDLSGTGF